MKQKTTKQWYQELPAYKKSQYKRFVKIKMNTQKSSFYRWLNSNNEDKKKILKQMKEEYCSNISKS